MHVSSSNFPDRLAVHGRGRRNCLCPVLRRATGEPIFTGIPWGLSCLSLWAYTCSGGTTKGAFRWPLRWRVDRYWMLSSIRGRALGICAGSEPDLTDHACHENSTPTSRSQSDIDGARACHLGGTVQSGLSGRIGIGDGGVCLEPHVPRSDTLSTCHARTLSTIQSVEAVMNHEVEAAWTSMPPNAHTVKMQAREYLLTHLSKPKWSMATA